MTDAAILKVVGISGVIPVQRLALDKADDHFLRFSALEQIVPVEGGTTSPRSENDIPLSCRDTRRSAFLKLSNVRKGQPGLL